jgi:hypothetical protein
MKETLMQRQFLIAGAVLAVLQAWDLIIGYLASGRFRRVDAEWEMRHVAIRMFLLTVGLMFGGAMLQKSGSPLPGLVLLVMLKTGVELWFAWNDRVLAAEATKTGNAGSVIQNMPTPNRLPVN